MVRALTRLSCAGVKGYGSVANRVINARTKEKIFFTRYSAADRSMLLMTRRPSCTTLGMDEKSEFSSTISETWQATSLPEAIATAQSADFRAKTSLTPSPVMATVRPAAFMASTSIRFCFGVTRPKTVYCSAAALTSAGVVRVRASTAFSASGMPARMATLATVAGLSPEMTLTCTPCSAK